MGRHGYVYMGGLAEPPGLEGDGVDGLDLREYADFTPSASEDEAL